MAAKALAGALVLVGATYAATRLFYMMKRKPPLEKSVSEIPTAASPPPAASRRLEPPESPFKSSTKEYDLNPGIKQKLDYEQHIEDKIDRRDAEIAEKGYRDAVLRGAAVSRSETSELGYSRGVEIGTELIEMKKKCLQDLDVDDDRRRATRATKLASLIDAFVAKSAANSPVDERTRADLQLIRVKYSAYSSKYLDA